LISREEAELDEVGLPDAPLQRTGKRKRSKFESTG